MNKIKWGIIGCGDVTEIKSGPAFNKVPGSELVAVMRRDAAKAADYARRHSVKSWYADAEQLISDPEVNAIYIATPPSSHKLYTIAALTAGKPVYVEKPMAINAVEAAEMATMAAAQQTKLTVAHYRREQPKFKKIKQLLNEKRIGEVRFCRLEFTRPAASSPLREAEKSSWRVDPSVSGGGLFHDLAPHQLDLMYYFFGRADQVHGIAANQGGHYWADDIVAGTMLFSSGVMFSGLWSFAAANDGHTDHCEIIGSLGKICFSVFDHNIISVTIDGKLTTYSFEPLQHVQLPMIEKLVQYFLGVGENPCSGEDGCTVMDMMDKMTT